MKEVLDDIITVDIMGEMWIIRPININTHKDIIKEGVMGWCDTTSREIFYYNLSKDIFKDSDIMLSANIDKIINETIRHEIIHAILYESGIDDTLDWAQNEEVIDYFAKQFPKLLKIFKELEVL